MKHGTKVAAMIRWITSIVVGVLTAQISLVSLFHGQETSRNDKTSARAETPQVNLSRVVVESTMMRYPNPSTQGSPSQASSAASSGVIKILPGADVRAAFAKGSPLLEKDGHNYWVFAGRRDKPGQAELHEKDLDIFYVLQGSATFVTGGKMVDGKTTAPGEVRGAAIEGGETHTLSKDDVVVIPPGIPHWFKDTQGLFLYYVVKVEQP
jgi:mannose-6-phosphate isomerase-like protein (cupin superfamily)